MKRLRTGLLLGLSALMALPVAWACGACLRDIADPAEYDKQTWDAAPAVFIARVTKAEASNVGGTSVEVTYTVESEEVLKGDPSTVKRVFTRRTVDRWDAGLKTIDCGYTSIAPGDRLLIFGTPEGDAVLSSCTASQVIEGKDLAHPERIAATLKRLRSWRD